MKRIQLNQTRSAIGKKRFALVDDDQHEWLNSYKWTMHQHPSGRCYAVRRNEDGVWLSMHREIMDMSGDYPVPRHLVIDHIDDKKGGLYNPRRNLEAISRKENTRRYHAKRMQLAFAR
jgi:hypothetical protein